MEITLNHTVIPAKNRRESAKWYEKVFGFEYLKDWGPFSVVKVNSTLTLDFEDSYRDGLSLHYAFKMSDNEFDLILGLLKEMEVMLASDPAEAEKGKFDGEIYTHNGGRGVYFLDPSTHLLEIMTMDYDLDNW